MSDNIDVDARQMIEDVAPCVKRFSLIRRVFACHD